MWLPFLYLGCGAIIGLWKNPRIEAIFGKLSSISLVILMIVIGANIGVDPLILSNVGTMGLNCLLLALGAILFSAGFSVLLEHTIIPLDELKKKIGLQDEGTFKEDSKGISLFMLGIPAYLVLGLGIGYFLIPEKFIFLLDYLMRASLFIIYLGVGISLGADLKVFRYIRILGWKVLLFPVAILAGSLLSAFLISKMMGISISIGVTAAAGMSYYSVTGAYMTEALGSEAGIYGFMVNVLREFLTVLLLPLLLRLGKSAPIAGGASGNMDTMLLPITRCIGPELGLVALVVGTILTLMVPFLLPLVAALG